MLGLGAGVMLAVNVGTLLIQGLVSITETVSDTVDRYIGNNAGWNYRKNDLPGDLPRRGGFGAAANRSLLLSKSRCIKIETVSFNRHMTHD